MLSEDLQIGAVFPQTELAGSSVAVGRFAAAAEELGFSHLLAYDHVLGARRDGREREVGGVYDDRDPFHDPFVLFAHLAGRHQRLGFVSGVLILPQRQTALVARQAADLAILSEGRFRLGVGVGSNRLEYETLGQDFGTRGRRLDEQIELLRAFWGEELVDFDGDFDRADRVASTPRPDSSVPIWIGGFGDAARRRCARTGDGFVFPDAGERSHESWRELRALVDAAGRPQEAVGGEAQIRCGGDVDEAISQISAWASAGGTHASIVTSDLGFDSVDAHVDLLERVARRLRAG